MPPSFGAGHSGPRCEAAPRDLVGTIMRVSRDGGLDLDKSRQRKSLSNPDIAPETLTLLSFPTFRPFRAEGPKPGGRPGRP